MTATVSGETMLVKPEITWAQNRRRGSSSTVDRHSESTLVQVAGIHRDCTCFGQQATVDDAVGT
jgi:hypothetical protein